jgi:hypothetical protein
MNLCSNFFETWTNVLRIGLLDVCQPNVWITCIASCCYSSQFLTWTGSKDFEDLVKHVIKASGGCPPSDEVVWVEIQKNNSLLIVTVSSIHCFQCTTSGIVCNEDCFALSSIRKLDALSFRSLCDPYIKLLACDNQEDARCTTMNSLTPP